MSIISELAFGQNSWTNLLPLCQGVALFATKAHQLSYRMGSRLAHNLPYQTVYNALRTMAEQKRGW
jgi:hypothetical protein